MWLRVTRRLTFLLIGAPQARPMQQIVRRHFHSERWTATTAFMPESEDDDLSRVLMIVDVVPDPR